MWAGVLNVRVTIRASSIIICTVPSAALIGSLKSTEMLEWYVIGEPPRMKSDHATSHEEPTA